MRQCTGCKKNCINYIVNHHLELQFMMMSKYSEFFCYKILQTGLNEKKVIANKNVR